MPDKQNVELNVNAIFKSKGLDEIRKEIDAFKAPLLSIDDKALQAERSKFQKEATRIENDFKKGRIDEEERNRRTIALGSKWEAFAIKASKRLVEGMSQAGEEFKKNLLNAIKQVEKSQKALDETRAKKDPIDEKFTIDTELGSIEANQKQYEVELAEEGLRIIEKTKKGKEELVKLGMKEGQSAGEIFKLRKAIRDEYGEGADEAIEQAIKEGKANEKLAKILESKNVKLNEAQKIGRLALLNQAKEEAGRKKIAEYAELEAKEFDQMADLQYDLNILNEEKIKLLEKIDQSTGSEKEKEADKEKVKALETVIKTTEKKLEVEVENTKQQKESSKATKDLNKALQGKSTTLGKAVNQVFNYGIAFTALRRIYRETLRTIRDLDKALTEMAIVTTMNRKEAWQLTDQMSALARETGFTISEISKLSTIYFRQGRVLSEVIELTRVAAMAARIAGISAAESADFLTSAVNAFQFSADQALSVSDRFAALASQSASSYEELAVGLSKFAAQANVAGVSIDFAMGMLAKGIETTREAPETIGTALKTVIARMRELTDLGKTFEDGMDISRVETALRQVGVALRDEQGQFRNLELVLQEIGGRWETLTTNQRASVAVALAGTRQQSRLIAIMQDFDRTMQLVDISQDSAGATAAQHVQFMQGLEGATIRMQAAYQDFITTISNSDLLIGIVNSLTSVIDALSSGLQTINGNSKFWMISLIALFGVLKLASTGTKIYNSAVERSIKLKELEDKGMKLSWYNSKRNTAAKKLQALETDLLTAKEAKKNASTLMGVNLENLETGARAKSILFIKLKIIAMKALNAVMAISPIFLFIGAMALLTMWMGRSADETARNRKELQEQRKELQAANYESRRTVTSIQRIMDQMEKFNNMPFLTPAQREELETLNSQLEEIYGEENRRFIARRLTDGEIDVELQAALNQQAIEEEINKLYERRLEIVKNIIEEQKPEEDIMDTLSKADFTFLSGGAQQTIEPRPVVLEPDIDIATLNELGDVFIEELDILFENELTPQAEKSFRRFLEVFDFSSLDFTGIEDDLAGFVKENFGDVAQVFQDFSTQVSEDLSLTERFRNFVKFFEEDIDEDLKEILQTRIQPGLNFLNSISNDDVEGLISTLDYLNLTTDNQIQELGSLFGDDLKNVLDLVATETQRLSEEQGLSPAQAQEIAWSTIIGSIEDTTKAIKLNNLIFTQSTTDMANSLDHLNSKLQRSRDIQQQWLEGTLGFEELAKFLNDNDDLFQSMEDVNRFLAGEAISDSVLIERFEEEQKALSRLFNARRQLAELEAETDIDEDTRQARRSALLAEIAAYQALIQATGELSRTTEAQTRYNAELERYNRLSEVGAETAEDFNRVLEAQSRFFEERTEKIGTDFEKLNERFQRSAQELGFASDSLEDYFTVIGGKIVPAFESLEGMSASSAEFIENILEEYQEGMDELFDLFMERRKFELDNEKKLLDDQKKVYEDYFAALDRLERGRERKRSREDLVSQLQRLEGATDERSRRRALELRRELNQTDEEESRTMIQEARQALLKTFDTAYEELEATWARMTADFIGALDSRGAATGEAMANNFANQINSEGLDVELDTNDLDSSLEALEGTLGDFVDSITAVFASRDLINQREAFVQRRAAELIGEVGSVGTGNIELAKEIAKEMAEQEAKAKFGFAKGGMVDFTGLAMLHGSKSAPEAVLNPMQTEMFMGLRDALEKVSFNPNGSTGSVQIENISISTGSMNSNQDFKRAGETLAEAFRGAIQRKGITLNTNKV